MTSLNEQRDMFVTSLSADCGQRWRTVATALRPALGPTRYRPDLGPWLHSRLTLPGRIAPNPHTYCTVQPSSQPDTLSASIVARHAAEIGCPEQGHELRS